jgi:DNA-binding IclR family transcriptional regulator
MPEWVIQAFGIAAGIAGGAGSVYAAIRADLAALHIKADQAAQAATRAHQRIDEFFNHQRRGTT